MANPYAFNVLTFAGAALIAQATAANPIVIVGAISRATAASSDEDLAAKDASWYTGKTGIIEAVSASANVAKIVARFVPEGARQDAKSVAVTARLASQTDADAIVLTAKSDPDATSILPGSGDTLSYVRFPFNIYIQTSGSVQVTPGASASIADLERFVSLHKAGDPTQGDEQDIIGAKHFLENVSVGGNLDVDGTVDVGDGLKTDVISARSPGNIELGSSLVPDTDGAHDIGSEDYNFRSAHVHYLASESMDGDEGGHISLAGVDPSSGSSSIAMIDLIAKPSNSDYYPSFTLRLENGYDGETCELTYRDGFLVGDSNNGACLGNVSHPWDGYFYDLYLRRLYKYNNATSITTDSLVPSGSAVYLGLPQLPFSDINATSFHGLDFLPLDNTADIGKNDNKFRKLYAKELHGVIPSISTYLEEPEVGAIFFAGITVSGAVAVNAGATAKVGLPLSSGGSNVTAIGTVTWDMQTNKFTGLASFTTSTGSYKLLCGVNKSSTDTYCCALVIRVS